jgi:hypothetical protein
MPLYAKRGGDVLEALGFANSGGLYTSAQTLYTVDLPPGPLAVGGDLITNWETIVREGRTLHVLSRGDVARDRLAASYFWDDVRSRRVAADVCAGGPVDRELVRDWSSRETHATKFAGFLRLVGH